MKRHRSLGCENFLRQPVTLGPTRKCRRSRVKSALPQRTDIIDSTREFRKVPLTEVGQLIRLPDRNVRVALVGW